MIITHSARNDPKELGCRRIGFHEGFDLEARAVANKGFYGSVPTTNLPELGPFPNEESTREALERILDIYIKYEQNLAKTLKSPEYSAALGEHSIE
jgi:hypothetical protein